MFAREAANKVIFLVATSKGGATDLEGVGGKAQGLSDRANKKITFFAASITLLRIYFTRFKIEITTMKGRKRFSYLIGKL